MKPLVIFGCGDFAQVAFRYFTDDSEYEVMAFTADACHVSASSLLGKEVCPFESVEQRFPPGECTMFVAIGYSKINRARRAVVERCRARGYALTTYLCSKAIAFGPLAIGDNSFVFEANVLQPFVAIGNNVVLWSGNHVGHHSTIEDDCFIAGHAVIAGHVRIGQGSFVGVNATISNSVSVGKENILGAGCLITRDTKDGEVYRGSYTRPASITSEQLWG